MKTIKLLLLFGLVIVGISVIMQVVSLFNNLKSETNLILTSAINKDFTRRVSIADLRVRVGANSSSPLNPKGVTISEADKKEFIPYDDTTRREDLLFNDNIIHQTVLRKLGPIEVPTLDSIFHSMMKQKGCVAKTSIRYSDLKNNKTYYSKPYIIAIHSSVTKLGVENEMEVQAYVKPSVQWVMDSISVGLWASIFLAITLSIILLICSIISKKIKLKMELKALPSNDVYNDVMPETDDSSNESAVVDEPYQDIKEETISEAIVSSDVNQVPEEEVSTSAPEIAPVNIKKCIQQLENGNYQVGNFILDTTIKSLIINGTSVYIGRRKEYILLLSLLTAPNYYLTTKEVAEKLDISNHKYNNRLNEAVSRLRTFLKEDPDISVVYKDRKGYVLQINEF